MQKLATLKLGPDQLALLRDDEGLQNLQLQVTMTHHLVVRPPDHLFSGLDEK